MTSLAETLGDLPLTESELLAWILSAADTHSIMAVTDAQGVILNVNDQFCAVSGYELQELVGLTHSFIKFD